MKQLKLPEDKLIKIGFKKKVYPEIKPDDKIPFGSTEKTTYEIPCLNGFFRININENIYVWYHDIITEDFNHSTLLNITSLPELYVILNTFNVDYNLIIS